MLVNHILDAVIDLNNVANLDRQIVLVRARRSHRHRRANANGRNEQRSDEQVFGAAGGHVEDFEVAVGNALCGGRREERRGKR